MSYPKNSTFAVFTLGNTNMADEQTYDVGSTLASLNYMAMKWRIVVDVRKIQNTDTVIVCMT
jgi:hypothetical protein